MRSATVTERLQDKLNEWELPLVGGAGDLLRNLMGGDEQSASADMASPLDTPAALMGSSGRRILTPALRKVQDELIRRFGNFKGRIAGDQLSDAVRFGRQGIDPNKMDHFANVADTFDFNAIEDIILNDPRANIASNLRGVVNFPNLDAKLADDVWKLQHPSQLTPPSQATPFPQTSTRVEDARRVVEDLGFGTETARRAVPRRGTDAENFVRGVNSINPVAVSDEIPTLQKLLGGPFTDLGRQGLGGASPKRVLESASGERWMHKGMPGWMPGDAASESDILRSIGGRNDAIAREEAGTRFANRLNQKTPIAYEVAEGGSAQKMIPGDLKTIDALESTSQLSHHVNDPAFVRQMQTEHIVDTLGRIQDRNRGQFMLDMNTGIMWPGDKGINDIDRYLRSPLSPNEFAGDVYHRFGQGGAWNRHIDPQLGQEFIQKRIMPVPETDFRQALRPVFRSRGTSQGDQDTAIRNLMQSIQGLPQHFSDYYRKVR